MSATHRDGWRPPYADVFRTRLEFVWTQTDLSSREVRAHLLFLGEFVAMYLFAWSDALWPGAGAGHRLLEAVR